ncbi:hypothetical protein C8Q80DRAFT_291326 [Daedaleopsis nitida]|nr:hypothetical protein C8Q80DRAFT_291326 [Daedaleopsis nitida]
MRISSKWIRISYSRFLSTFWPIPARYATGYRENPLRRTSPRGLAHKLGELSKGIRREAVPTESFTRCVNDARLAHGFTLTVDPNTPSAHLSEDRWAFLERDVKTKPDWAKQKVLFRFSELDPFHHLDYYEENRDDYILDRLDYYRKIVLDDITAKVQDQWLDQHLTAVFVVIVHESTLRLTRWDRTGVLVTDNVNYLENSEFLPELFWRISVLTDEQLGWDPTATAVLPGSTDHALMERLREARPDDFPCEEGSVIDGDVDDPSRTFAFARKRYDSCLSGSEARWRLSIPLEDGTSHDFLVGRPFSHDDSGERNGRAYIAVDCETGGFVFLKDAWRYTYDSGVRLREGQVLARLNQAGVPHVPTLVCEADLPGQSARTRDFHPKAPSQRTGVPQDDDADEETAFAVEEDYENGALRAVHHYRVVVRELCIDLRENLKSGRQLMTLLKNWITAHAGAATLEGSPLLHGDISEGNCMIHPIFKKTSPGRHVVQWEGMLIDWELNTPLPDAEVNLTSLFGKIMKTWQYASVAYSLRRLVKKLAIADDMESFLWMTLYIAVRFLRTDFSFETRKVFLEELQRHDRVPGWKCRTITKDELWGGEFDFVLQGRDKDYGLIDSPINDFFVELVHLCHAVYLRDNMPKGHKMQLRPPSADDTGAGPCEMVYCKTLARKLDDHTAVLELIDDVLSKEWPLIDYVGDQLGVSREPEPPKPAEEPAAVEDEKENKPVKVKAAKGKKKAVRATPATRRGKHRAAAKKPAPPARSPVKCPGPQSEHEEKVAAENPLKRRRNPLRQCQKVNVTAQSGERPAKRRRH